MWQDIDIAFSNSNGINNWFIYDHIKSNLLSSLCMPQKW
jgi:hypothetical protein